VGNATENKNFRTLAEAMTIIGSADPEIALVHVGDDPDEILAQTLQRMSSPVRLLRFSGIDDAQLANLYHNAACLCVPSFYEGFCLPILEAQICGCPVVCSNRSAMPEIAGKVAILADPTDPVALADSLVSVLESPAKAATLVRLGLENARQFSWEQTARRYQDLFTRLLATC
jgi:glycosyltransferase involved in cell wall biosynthesis